MMVGNDSVHAQAFRISNVSSTADAVVDGYQEACAGVAKRAYRIPIKPVAFFRPVRNMDNRPSLQDFERFGQEGGGSYAVRVIIAEYGDDAAGLDMPDDELDGLLHLPESKGVVEDAVVTRFEELPDFPMRKNAPVRERLPDSGMMAWIF